MRKSVIMPTFAALVVSCSLAIGPLSTSLSAQGSKPLVGSIGPSAFGPPAPTPAPVGGLPTRPLSSGTTNSARPDDAARRDGANSDTNGDSGYRWSYGRDRARVVDAPYGSHGVVAGSAATSDRDTRTWSNSEGNGWLPSAAKPQWIRDTTVTPVAAWRDLVVTDMMCSSAGFCVERQQRVRARWMASYGCYAFFDSWNRLWRVE